MQLIPGVVFLVMGIAFVVFWKPAAYSAIKWNKKILGVTFKEWHYKIPFISVGFVFIVLGILALTGIMEFPPV